MPSSTLLPSRGRLWPQRAGSIACKQLGCGPTLPATTWTLGLKSLANGRLQAASKELHFLVEAFQIFFRAFISVSISIYLSIYIYNVYNVEASIGCVSKHAPCRGFRSLNERRPSEVLGAYCRSGRLVEAEKLLETIFARGLRANTSSLNLMLPGNQRSLRGYQRWKLQWKLDFSCVFKAEIGWEEVMI